MLKKAHRHINYNYIIYISTFNTGKDFEETKIIKEIVSNMEDHRNDPRPQLSPLAEKLVVHYHSCFCTVLTILCVVMTIIVMRMRTVLIKTDFGTYR